MKYRFVAKYRTTWPTGMLCHALGVSRSGFYAWQQRGPSVRAQRHAVLLPLVRTYFVQSDRTYGAKRILRDVREAGHWCGRHQVAGLMRRQALRARPRKRALPVDRGVRPSTAPAANVLDRQFVATAPNQKWVADFTYVWTAEGWLYVAVVLDLYSRRVVGWAMQAAMTSQLVTDALMMALWRRGTPQALLHHSDRGSQYTSDDFQRLLRDLGVTCSMSRAGNVWDNAVMESFFSTLKTERTARKAYQTRNAARADVFDYIERFYNPVRRHSTLGYVSPMKYEELQAEVA
jgi:putative transposase